MWDYLTLRFFGMSNEEEENIWIMDTAVDQRVVTKKVRRVEISTGMHARCNNFLGNNSPSIKYKVVSAIAVVSALSIASTLIRAPEAVLIEDETQSESLLHLHQATEHYCKFNLTLIGHRGTNDSMGDPKLSAEEKYVSFNFDESKSFYTIRKPVESELGPLPVVESTVTLPYEPKA